MEFPVLWSGFFHSVLGALVNSTGYIKDCEQHHQAAWQKVPHKVL